MKAVFIGAGNVATHLALALQSKGITISQIFSRTSTNAKLLGEKLGVSFTCELTELDRTAEVYIYAIKDSALRQLIPKIALPQALHVHTAGSISLRVFEGYAERYGVIYPLQTFSKNKAVDFSQIPICIEANSPEVEQELLEIAHLLTPKTYILNSEQRKQLHLSAVFACNFTNHMYAIAADLVESAGLPFDILQPLIAETADKIRTMSPRDAQTGPAVRFDEETISKHLSMLKEKPDLVQIYKDLSQNIYQKHKKK